MAEDAAFRLFAEIAEGPDDAIDLAESALLIAQAEYPSLDRLRYLAQIDALGDEARRRVGRETSPYAQANIVSEFLFEDEKFLGNESDYYDPRNSYLNDVLDRRLGIPITLSLIYIEVARRCGMAVSGAGLPGHFVVRYDAPEERIILDPFRRGIILTGADCAALVAQTSRADVPFNEAWLLPVTPRDILSRMLNNLKTIHLNHRDVPRALAAVERLLVLHPRDAHEAALREKLRDIASS